MIVEIYTFRRYKDTPLDHFDPIIQKHDWCGDNPGLVLEISYFPQIVWDRLLRNAR